jgi:phage-related protein
MVGVRPCWPGYRGCRTIQIIGEAGLRIGAITRDLRRTLQRSVNDALAGLKAPKQNALTQLQRELNRGELALANAVKAKTDAQRAATAAEEELVAVRKDENATTEQLAAAEEKHRRSLLNLRVAIDDVNTAAEKRANLQDRLRRGNVNTERDNNRVSRSFGVLFKSLQGLGGGLLRTVASGSKLALIGTAAGGAVAGVASLTVGVGALVAALGQAAGAAGLLPAVIAGKWAIIGTAKLALTGFGDAMKAVASGDAAKLDEALKDMSPSAQRFVREVNKVKPAFDRVRLDVQERAFAGLAGSIQPLADRYLPQLDALSSGIAASMNQAAKETIRYAMSGEALKNTQITVAQLQTSASNLAPAFQPAVRALMDVVSVGSTFLPRLTENFAGGIQSISGRIHEMAANGELEAFFQRALDTISQLGRIAGNVGGIISGIFNAAKSGGAGFLDNLEAITESMSRFVNSARGQEAISGFFQAMRTIMAALMPVIQQVAVVLGTTLAPIIANIAATILPALLPLLQAFGRLLAAAAPLIDVLAETLAVLFAAFAPVLDIFAQALQDVMPQLLPAIMAIGEALVELITAAAPLVPLFAQLLVALLPILPPIIQLAASLLPILVAVITALMPVIQALVGAFQITLPIFAAVAQVIGAVLLPPIRLIATVITGVVNIAVAIFSFFANAIRVGVQKVISFIGFLASIPGKVGAWFGRMKDAAIQRAVAMVNWVKGLPGRIGGALGGLAGRMLQAGIDAIAGLLNGLKNAAGAVIDWIKGLAGDLIDSVLGVFGIASPSKVFHGIGLNLGRGLVTGIQEITPDVMAAAARMADQATRSVTIAPTVDAALQAGLTRALADPATPTGSDGASTPESIADALVDALADVQVVVSATEVTSKVNRVNRGNKRR